MNKGYVHDLKKLYICCDTVNIRCEDCGKLYVMLRDAKDKFTSPPGIIKNIPGKRSESTHSNNYFTEQNSTCTYLLPCKLAEIFMSENTEDLKKKVIENFVEKETATRIVICTETLAWD